MPEGELAALTDNTHTTRAALHADLAEVRERGYSVDREETVAGLAGFGFALRYDEPATDAISCSVPVTRLTPEHELRIITVMRETRAKIEERLPSTSGAPDWR
ncbi:DNA-binding IclR family transcriptional regulator [Streptomyces turgidiscabies]|uniref:DNA-binding IclR family transcriptional regulator n=1 Tax=Streptomyces turgidiscabies TaxID=85558 RepID=A0ABU0RS06_9ACTN|nr:DNA-binding IclR family transcriptional regulator [Streptomyces turgidiscabies]